MKYNLFIVLLILSATWLGKGVLAENHVEWGMKLALEGELPGKWKNEMASVTMFKPGIGVNIGGVAHIHIGRKFYFEPSLSLFNSSYKYKDLIISNADDSVTESDPKLTKWGVQLPLVIGYEIDFSDRFGLTIFTGPQMRFAFAGKIDIKNKTLKEDFGNYFDLWGINGQRRFDLSWKVGGGVPIPIRDCVFTLEADFGITDLLKDGMSFRENRIGLGFTKYL